MTLDEKFVQALMLRPPKVLGVQLRPYCAGHALLLDALGNSFVTPGADWSLEDLGVAVLVCSRSFEAGRRLVVPRGRGDRLPVRTRLLLWLLGWRARRRAKFIEHEIAAFAAYLEDYQQMPDYWGAQAGSLNAPWPYSAAVGTVIALKGAVSLAEAWNLPLSESVFYAATVADLYGDDGLMSQRDKAGLAAVRDGSWRRPARGETTDCRLQAADSDAPGKADGRGASATGELGG